MHAYGSNCILYREQGLMGEQEEGNTGDIQDRVTYGGTQSGDTVFPESCQEFGKCEHRLSSKECPKESDQESDRSRQETPHLYRDPRGRIQGHSRGRSLPSHPQPDSPSLLKL